MPELRVEMPKEVLAVLDGYCSATGQCRTELVRTILSEWTLAKHREAEVIIRVAGRFTDSNPMVPDTY